MPPVRGYADVHEMMRCGDALEERFGAAMSINSLVAYVTKDMDFVLPSAVADFGIETEEQWQATRARIIALLEAGENAALVLTNELRAAQGLRLVEARKEGGESEASEELSPEEEARVRRENIRDGKVDDQNHLADVDTDEEADAAIRRELAEEEARAAAEAAKAAATAAEGPPPPGRARSSRPRRRRSRMRRRRPSSTSWTTRSSRARWALRGRP